MEDADIGRSVFSHEGWRFETIKRGALSSAGRAAMAGRFELPHVPLPEMLFADNALLITHMASGLCVRFAAEDALATWAQAQRREHHTAAISFDVAYTCDYRGTLPESWTPMVTDEMLPLDRLREHAPILFYDDVILFEGSSEDALDPAYALVDDIRDLGEVECSVKIRVMNFGFLVLCRYYARLDNKFVKLHDARYYHEFGTALVLRDFETREALPHELQKTGGEMCFVPTANFVYEAVLPARVERQRLILTPNDVDFVSAETKTT
ncbi:hypothetical protein ACHHYP_16141 [Achlya hypogyna]|uniref:TIP41-like protein n=1 Tax=Achlya hypogyna TaxID=1202772 RepID=A0A1V9Y9Q7_ACHHY|nr:hypothetical protein ACHHYP_16141 [Achlya hypogyna]